MRALSASVLVFSLILACVAFAQTSPNPSELYAVGATVTPGANGYYTVRVTVTEKAGGAVVFAPSVTLPAGTHAEAFSDPAENKPLFECAIDVNASGKANVTFKAYQLMLQRSRVEAVVQPR